MNYFDNQEKAGRIHGGFLGQRRDSGNKAPGKARVGAPSRPSAPRPPGKQLQPMDSGDNSGSLTTAQLISTRSKQEDDSQGLEVAPSVVWTGSKEKLAEAAVYLEKIQQTTAGESCLLALKKSVKTVKIKMPKKVVAIDKTGGAALSGTAKTSVDAATESVATAAKTAVVVSAELGDGAKTAQSDSDEGRRVAKKRRVTIAPVKCRTAEEQLKEGS